MNDGQKLDAILEGVRGIERWQAGHEGRHLGLEAQVIAHHETLYGNGKPGLKAELQAVEARCNQSDALARVAAKAAGSRLRDRILPALATNLITAAIVAVAAWLLWLYAMHPGP